MLPITALDLENWGQRIEARHELPVLMRHLVHGSSTPLKRVNFPAYEAVGEGGWDGEVDAELGDAWVPRGASAWELSCKAKQRLKGKADEDYEKRTAALEGSEGLDTTYVFATTSRWPGKRAWCAARRGESRWADVRVYDAEGLAQWLEVCPAAQAWMASKLGRPGDELRSLDDVWREWAGITKPKLPFAIFEQALGDHRQRLQEFFGGDSAAPLEVFADTRDEAAAFLAGTLLFTDVAEQERYRAVEVTAPAGLQRLRALNRPVTIMVRDRQVEAALGNTPDGARILVASDKASMSEQARTVIEPLTWDAFRKVADNLDLAESDRERLDSASGRRISVLRRRLATVPAVRQPSWTRVAPDAIRVLPALALAGGWVWENEEDRTTLAALAGVEATSLEREMQRLSKLEDAPIFLVGTVGGIISRPDAFAALRGTLTTTDLDRFFTEAQRVLAEADPALELPEERRWAASVYGKSRRATGRLRQNLAETAAFIGASPVPLVPGYDGAWAAQRLVAALLGAGGADAWLNVRDMLPALAEASPEAFLAAIERDLPGREQDQGVWRLVHPVDKNGHQHENYRTGLLWGLERIAWAADRFPRVASVLAALAERPLDDNWVNRPAHSLRSCLHPWLPQTAAPEDIQVKVLARIGEAHPSVGWALASDIVDQRLGHASYSSRPKHRPDAVGHGHTAAYSEPLREAAMDLLLGRSELDLMQIKDLITKSDCFGDERRERLWSRIQRWSESAADEDRAEAREHLRKMVRLEGTRRQNRAGVGWDADPRARELFERLSPEGLAARYRWLFASPWVEFGSDELEGYENDWRAREDRVAATRAGVVQEVWQADGLDGLVAFAREMTAPAVVADVAARAIAEFDYGALLELLRRPELEDWQDRSNFVGAALWSLDESVRDTLIAQKVGLWATEPDRAAELLCISPPSMRLWDLVESLNQGCQAAFWKGFRYALHLDDKAMQQRACGGLLTAKRPVAAFHQGHLRPELLNSGLILSILTDVALVQGPATDEAPLSPFSIEAYLKVLDSRDDYDRQDLLKIEYIYCRHLEHTGRGIKALSEAIATDPSIIVEGLAACYKRDDGSHPIREGQERQAEQAWEHWMSILDHCRLGPGSAEDGILDAERLADWMERAHQLLTSAQQTRIGMHKIGELLGRTRVEVQGLWPTLEVARVLEPWASESFQEGVYIGIVNSRGVHSRSAALGGVQERALADKFRSWRRHVEFDAPNLAKAFEQVARSYDQDARREDEWAALERQAP